MSARLLTVEYFKEYDYIVSMKKIDNLNTARLNKLEAKIDNLQESIDELDKKLATHISFIEKVYDKLRNPISNIKNIFG